MQRIKLTNSYDAERVRRGELAAEATRSLEVDALVDTGATTLALPADLSEQLDLTVIEETTVRIPLEELDLVVEPRSQSLRVRHLDGRHGYILSAA